MQLIGLLTELSTGYQQRRIQMSKNLLKISAFLLAVLVISGFTFDFDKPLVSRFMLSQSISNGEPVKLNRNLYIITGGETRGLTALKIK
jgi:uncharacterized protein with PQ loop repeat